MTLVNIEEALGSICKSLRQLRPPEWTRHEDFSGRPLTWWVDEMHPEWMAEEYLQFISETRLPLLQSDRDRVKKIGLLAKELADNMKRCRSHELITSFHQSKINNVCDRPLTTFSVLYCSLDRLEYAAENIEYAKEKVPRGACVALLAARHFNRITWRDPGLIVDKVDGVAKASGQFLELVQSVYQALKITASAERNAKKAAAAHKSAKQELPPELNPS